MVKENVEINEDFLFSKEEELYVNTIIELEK